MAEVDIDRRRLRSVKYLCAAQNRDGSFDGLSGPDIGDFSGAASHQTVLQQATILRALSEVELPGVVGLRTALARFLRKQASSEGSFNYWVRSSERAKSTPYPDDLDDTACAWLALAQQKELDGAALAKISRLLVAAEVDTGGPYRTWLVGEGAEEVWRDVDAAVNANIWALLQQIGVRLEGLENWLARQVDERKAASAYYPGWAPVLYFLSSVQEGELATAVRRRCEQELGRRAKRSALEAALLLVTGLRCGVDRAELRPLVDRLVDDQRADGSWAPYGFCYDPAEAHRRYYAGSETLTTAIALQALTLWGEGGSTTQKEAVISRRRQTVTQSRSALVWPVVRRQLQGLPVELQELAEPIMRKVERLDRSHGVTSLATHVLQAVPMARPGSKSSLRRQRNSLMQGSLYGWLAYTASDDVLDGEASALVLPLIQLWMVEMRHHFWMATPDEQYQLWANRRLWATTVAHDWELRRTRFSGGRIRPSDVPAYAGAQIAFDRAAGHSIAPVGALVVLGYDHRQPVTQALMEALRRLIVARQLHDDAHDWVDDLRQGHINQVAAQILDGWFRRYPDPIDCTDEAVLQGLRRLFWQEVSAHVLLDIDRNLNLARRALDQNRELLGLRELYAMVERLQQTTDGTRRQREEALSFWREFTADSAAGRSAL